MDTTPSVRPGVHSANGLPRRPRCDTVTATLDHQPGQDTTVAVFFLNWDVKLARIAVAAQGVGDACWLVICKETNGQVEELLAAQITEGMRDVVDVPEDKPMIVPLGSWLRLELRPTDTIAATVRRVDVSILAEEILS